MYVVLICARMERPASRHRYRPHQQRHVRRARQTYRRAALPGSLGAPRLPSPGAPCSASGPTPPGSGAPPAAGPPSTCPPLAAAEQERRGPGRRPELPAGRRGGTGSGRQARCPARDGASESRRSHACTRRRAPLAPGGAGGPAAEGSLVQRGRRATFSGGPSVLLAALGGGSVGGCLPRRWSGRANGQIPGRTPAGLKEGR